MELITRLIELMKRGRNPETEKRASMLRVLMAGGCGKEDLAVLDKDLRKIDGET